LAGISTEYYIKLEQGQETHPTLQVLESLSSALKLDATARSYLRSLARLVESPVNPVSAPTVQRAGWLIDSWPMTAAMILDSHNDILAANALMASLVPGFSVGSNALAAQLLDPSMRNLYLDWEGLSVRSIGLMRSLAGPNPDERSRELIAQLLRESPRFREVWERHDIVGMSEGTHPMLHPIVGPMSLNYAHLPLSGSGGCSIFLYYAEPGTDTEQGLAQLAAGR
jgi:transcriptional regulator with XRE-family HTH domain